MNLFEVFEEIHVKPDIESAFREVDVIKVTASRSSGRTIVHLKSKHLLEYKQIEEMEQALTSQFFGRMCQKSELSIEYQLSGQYNPESLWNLYKESVMDEVGKESRMASFLLKRADISFDLSCNPSKMFLKVEADIIKTLIT